jgi:hypothetical protein
VKIGADDGDDGDSAHRLPQFRSFHKLAYLDLSPTIRVKGSARWSGGSRGGICSYA